MSISSAFAAGRQAVTQVEAQKLGLLSALINRPMAKSGRAVLAGSPSGRREEESAGGGEAVSWERNPVDPQERKQEMLEEVHGQAMEQGDLKLDILRQAQTERETAAAKAAVDRDRAEREETSAREIREGARQDTLDSQERNRHYKAYYAAIYRGDAAGADRHFRGMFKGMEGDTRPATVKRQQRDEKGELMWKDEAKEIPLMMETPEHYGAEGKLMKEEDYQNQQMAFPKHRSDGGVVYMQFGNNEPRPVGPKILRQLNIATNPAAMQPVGSGQGGVGGVQTGAKATSAKDASAILLNDVKRGKSFVDGGINYADAKPAPLPKDEDYDPYNPPAKSAQQYQKDFIEGMGIISKMAGSPSQQKEMGLPGSSNVLGEKASKLFARKSREFYDNSVKKGIRPDVRQMAQRAYGAHGVKAATELIKEFASELTPGDLIYKADSPKEVPDLGHGKDSVIHIYDKGLKIGFAIDTKLNRFVRWDKGVNGWKQVEPAVEEAYVGLLNEKANQGDKKAEKMLEVLNRSIRNIGAAISDAAKKEASAMGRWAGGEQKPEQLDELEPKSDVALTQDYYNR